MQACPSAIGLALLASCLVGCFEHRYLGVVSTPVTPEREVPLTCLSRMRGYTPTFVEGDLTGKPAVFADYVTGFRATLHERHEVDGTTVYAGQSCVLLQSGPGCDTVLYAMTGDKRVFYYWATFDPPGTPPVLTTRAIVDESRDKGLFVLADRTELDATSLQAMTAIGDERFRAMAVKVGVMVAGAAAQGVGQAKHNANITRTGAELAKIADSIEIPAGDREYAAKYPKLAPVFQALALLGEHGAVCYGRARPVAPPPP